MSNIFDNDQDVAVEVSRTGKQLIGYYPDQG